MCQLCLKCGKRKPSKVGDFVRMLGGECRDLCGHITSIDGVMAIVRIDYLSKLIHVHTPVRNLIKLNVPPARQVYYYCDEVRDLEDTSLIVCDLKAVADPLTHASKTAKKPVANSRRKTVTHLVRSLLESGVKNPNEIGKIVIEAIKTKKVKAPKNLFIVFGIIKAELMKFHGVKSFKALKRKHSELCHFSSKTLAKIDPTLGIPIRTPVEKVADDKRHTGRNYVPKPRPLKLPTDKCCTCHHQRYDHARYKEMWGRCHHKLSDGGQCICKYFRNGTRKCATLEEK